MIFKLKVKRSRKLAIENLSGGEKDRINWMTKFMSHNKVFKYYSINKNETEKESFTKST